MLAKTEVVNKVTAKEAYEIIKRKHPDKVVVECLEFNNFYAFALADKGTENEPAGGGYDTVDKSTGKIDVFSPVEDFEAFFTAKEIKLSTFNN